MKRWDESRARDAVGSCQIPVRFGERRDRFVSQIGQLAGAGEGIRTLDVNLGKVALYH